MFYPALHESVGNAPSGGEVSSAPFEQPSTFADNYDILTTGCQVDPDTSGTGGHEGPPAFTDPPYETELAYYFYPSIPSYRAGSSNNPSRDYVGTQWPEPMGATRFNPVFNHPAAEGYSSPSESGPLDPQGTQCNLWSSDPRFPTTIHDLPGPSGPLNSYEGDATLLPLVVSGPEQPQPVMLSHETFLNSMYTMPVPASIGDSSAPLMGAQHVAGSGTPDNYYSYPMS